MLSVSAELRYWESYCRTAHCTIAVDFGGQPGGESSPKLRNAHAFISYFCPPQIWVPQYF